MNTLDGLPLLDHSRQLSDTGERKYAWNILNDFFNAFEKKDAHEILWFMLTAALKSSNEDISSKERSEMIFFYEYCLALLDAAEVLHDRKRGYTKHKWW